MRYYQTQSVNVHRSSHSAAAKVTAEFESARVSVQQFIGANQPEEIVWTKGATESINLVAHGLAQSYFKPGDEIVISALEHHANIVPWQHIALTQGLSLKVMPVDNNGVLNVSKGLKLITDKTKLLACTHVSNALGNINPVQSLIRRAKEVGALTLLDGTQAVSHLAVDVCDLDCDFYVFSGHKMFGPTGVGVLYGKYIELEKLPPYQFGGEMIESVSFQQSTFQPPPLKFEAGTPNIAGVLGLAKAVGFIDHNRTEIQATEQTLYQSLLSALQAIPEVKTWGDDQNSISLLSFTVKNISQFDLGVLLNKQNIAIRVGHHCAMPLMNLLAIDGTLRVSLAPYNTLHDIETFVSALKHSIGVFNTKVSEPQLGYLHDSALSVDPPIAQLIKQSKSWDHTYRQLMLAGKGLVRLTDEFKTEATAVVGCESQVWVQCSWVNERLVIAGDSPSKIIRGLLAVLFEALEGKTVGNVLAFDHKGYFDELKLGQHLSQSRGNGMAAVVNKIRQTCQQYCDNQQIEN